MTDSQISQLVESAGVTPSAAQVMVGNLILENNRYDFAFRQLRKLHGKDSGGYCKCGKLIDRCQSRAVILVFDEYEPAVER